MKSVVLTHVRWKTIAEKGLEHSLIRDSSKISLLRGQTCLRVPLANWLWEGWNRGIDEHNVYCFLLILPESCPITDDPTEWLKQCRVFRRRIYEEQV